MTLALAVGGPASRTSAQPANPLSWVPCPRGAPAAAKCGELVVPEDHYRAGGRTIRLAFARIPAKEPAAPDPVLVLLGGPGDAGMDRLAGLVESHREANHGRDLIFIDQRGVGLSAPLDCSYADSMDAQRLLADFLPSGPLTACRDRLRASADLARYRTVDFIRDLEALRRSLGIERWNLHGNSYGSRIALGYAARHRDRVRTLALIAVAPPIMIVPTTFPGDLADALDRILAACAREAPCRAAYPDLPGMLRSTIARAEAGTARARVSAVEGEATEEVRVSRTALGEGIRAMLYTPRGASDVPRAIAEASTGDFSRLALVAYRRQFGFATNGRLGIYLAVHCTEDFTKLSVSDEVRRAAGTLMGSHRVEAMSAVCRDWPRRDTPDRALETGPPTVPTLMIVGEDDPVSPPRWARELLGDGRGRRLVTVPRGGHGFAGMSDADCVQRMAAAFFVSGAAEAVDASCVAAMRPPPFRVAP